MTVLPSEYQRVEYIQSSGTQYIDTGFIPTNNTKVKLSMGGFSGTGASNCLFGARASRSADASVGRGLQFSVNATTTPRDYGGMFGRNYGPQSGMTSGMFDWADGGDYILEVSQSGFYENGVNKFTPQTVTFTSPVDLYIFSNNTNGTISEQTAYKLYYFEIYESGTLVRDFVPCYRKSDRVVGLYDVVNDQFYTNAGTGKFISGPVRIPKIGKVYVWRRVPRLPSEYQEVEYIQSSGTQYVNTLYIPSVNTKIETDIQWGTQSTSWAAFFGVTGNDSSTDGILGRIYSSTSTNFNPWFCNATYGERQITTTINAWHNIVLKSGSCNLDGTSYTITTSSTPYQSSIDLFAGNNGGTHGWRTSQCAIKTFKIYESGTLVRDFVPCYRKSDNVIGMYDLVNNRFYTNLGSGTFTKGGDVVESVSNTVYKEFLVRPTGGDIEYSYDFRNKSWSTVQNDGWVLKQGTSWTTINSNGIVMPTKGQGDANTVKIYRTMDFHRAKKITIQCNYYGISQTWGNYFAYGMKDDTGWDGWLSWGTTTASGYQDKWIGKSKNTDLRYSNTASTGTYTSTVVYDLVNKGISFTRNGLSTLTGTMSDADIEAIRGANCIDVEGGRDVGTLYVYTVYVKVET